MIILSLFDGCGIARQALKNLGVECEYHASEIDKRAIQVAMTNHPDIKQVGDIRDLDGRKFKNVDLLIFGSPCQGFSIAGSGLNFDHPQSKLFFEAVRILDEVRPKHFLMENVRMKSEWRDIISSYLGVQPVMINSALVSAQERKRYYWADFEIKQPDDLGIYLKSVLETPGDKRFLSEREITYMNRRYVSGSNHWHHAHSSVKNKSECLVANLHKGVPYNVIVTPDGPRKYTPVECERLQTLPDRYTSSVSDTQAYRMLGNGFTCKIIEHILKPII